MHMNLKNHFQKGSVHISVVYLRLELNNVYIKKVRGIVSLYTVLSTRGRDCLRNQKYMYNISILTYQKYMYKISILTYKMYTRLLRFNTVHVNRPDNTNSIVQRKLC